MCGFSQTADCSLTECGSLQLSLQWGNKSCLYLKKTNDPAVLKLSVAKVVWTKSKHLIKLHAFCMFYGSSHSEEIAVTSRCASYETVELSGAEKKVYLCRDKL